MAAAAEVTGVEAAAQVKVKAVIHPLLLRKVVQLNSLEVLRIGFICLWKVI